MFQKIKQNINKDKVIFWIILIIYTVLITYISLHHEFTQDETQSWLIARDLNPIEIIKQMRYEGHSFLWHFLIFPFAKLGLPIFVQKIIPVLFSIATIFLLWKYAPFSKILKTLITFSSGMIYYYSSFARLYCMIPFFLVVIASLYQKRKERPYLYAISVGLLAHTHLVMLPVVGLLVFQFWVNELLFKRNQYSKDERKKLIKSFLLVVAIILIYLVIAIYGTIFCEIPSNVGRYNHSLLNSIFYYFNYTLNSLVATFYGGYYINYNNIYEQPFIPNIYIIFVLIFLLLCLIGSKKSIKYSLFFWTQIIFMTIVHATVWFYLPIRIFLIIYVLMFWVWLERLDHKKNNWTTSALIFIILISFPGTCRCIYEDIHKKASAGVETTQFIEENIPKGSVFINIHVDFQQILAAYLKKDEYLFYMASADEFRTFNIWDKSILENTTSQDILNDIKRLKSKYKHIYLLIPIFDNYYYMDVNISKINKEYQLYYLYTPKKYEMMNSFYFCNLVTFNIVEVSEREEEV